MLGGRIKLTIASDYAEDLTLSMNTALLLCTKAGNNVVAENKCYNLINGKLFLVYQHEGPGIQFSDIDGAEFTIFTQAQQ